MQLQGTRVGTYTIGRTIGQGATGSVHEAVGDDGEPVAIKLLHPQLSSDPATVDQFVNERRILADLEHPNVMGVRDLIVDAESATLAIVMERAGAGDLADLLRSGVAPTTAIELTIGIARGLAAIHDAGIVHRDIKPSNILLDSSVDDDSADDDSADQDGVDQHRGTLVPRITDFGTSRLLERSISSVSGIVATPLYLAPEVFAGNRAGPAADVYALGVLLFELLIGTPPFTADHPMAVARAHSDDPVPPIRGVPDRVNDLVQTMMAKDPGDRPAPAMVAAALTITLPLIDPTDRLSVDAGHTDSITALPTPVAPAPIGGVAPAAIGRETAIDGRRPPFGLGAGEGSGAEVTGGLMTRLAVIGGAAVLVLGGLFGIVRVVGGSDDGDEQAAAVDASMDLVSAGVTGNGASVGDPTSDRASGNDGPRSGSSTGSVDGPAGSFALDRPGDDEGATTQRSPTQSTSSTVLPDPPADPATGPSTSSTSTPSPTSSSSSTTSSTSSSTSSTTTVVDDGGAESPPPAVPVISIAGPSEVECWSPNRTYSVVNTGAAITSWNWNSGRLGLQSPFNAGPTAVLSFDTDPGTYSVTVTVNGGEARASKAITVTSGTGCDGGSELPQPVISGPGAASCGASVAYSLLSNGAPITTASWSSSTVTITGSSPSGATFTFPDTPGSYSVSAVVDEGVTTQRTFTVSC